MSRARNEREFKAREGILSLGQRKKKERILKSSFLMDYLMARPFERRVNIELLIVNFSQIYKLQECVNGSKMSNERLKKEMMDKTY